MCIKLVFFSLYLKSSRLPSLPSSLRTGAWKPPAATVRTGKKLATTRHGSSARGGLSSTRRRGKSESQTGRRRSTLRSVLLFFSAMYNICLDYYPSFVSGCMSRLLPSLLGGGGDIDARMKNTVVSGIY